MTDLHVTAIAFVLLCAESAALYPWTRRYEEVRVAPRAAQRDRPPMPGFVPVRPYRTTPTQQFKHAPTGRDLKAPVLAGQQQRHDRPPAPPVAVEGRLATQQGSAGSART